MPVAGPESSDSRVIAHIDMDCFYVQDALQKFASKSCPLRYGIAKILEDALNLFHSALCEYIGIQHVRTEERKHLEWATTGLSVTASKKIVIPFGTHSIMKYFHNKNQTCTSINKSDDICPQDMASLSSSDNHEDEAKTKHDMPSLNPDGEGTEVCKARQVLYCEW